MIKKFSTAWKGSKKPSKQRKYRNNAPLHIKQSLVKSALSKELKLQQKVNALTPRKGDSVKIMRGQFKGKTGKVEEVQLERMRVYVEGIGITKKDGKKARRPLDASNLMITAIVQDKKRNKKNNTTKPTEAKK